jgi:ankyrin repeat protein
MLAATAGHTSVVQLLLDSQADINTPDRVRAWHAVFGFMHAINVTRNTASALTPVHAISSNLARLGHIPSHRFLTSAISIPNSNQYGWTPMMAAASAGHVSVVTLLISKGADVNIPCNVSHVESTILFIAVNASSTCGTETGDKLFSCPSPHQHMTLRSLRGAHCFCPYPLGWTNTSLHQCVRGTHHYSDVTARS